MSTPTNDLVFNTPVKKQPVDAARVQAIYSNFQNPSIAYNTWAAVLGSASLDEFAMAGKQYANYLDGLPGFNDNPDLIDDVRRQRRQEAISKSFAAWAKTSQLVYDQFQVLRSDVLKAVKKAKFPLANSSDPMEKLEGQEQWRAAQALPLKYINIKMLQNCIVNGGKTDYISNVLERVGLCRSEFRPNEYETLVKFAFSFYNQLGVQVLREFVQFLDLLIAVVGIQKDSDLANAGSLNGAIYNLDNSVRINLLEQKWTKQSQVDNLCES